MPSLQDVFAELSGPRLNWITGTVTAVAGGYATISYLGGTITRCGYLDQYTPVVGDSVHALSLEGQGVLILGSNNGTPGGPPAPTEQTPVIVNTSATGTYREGVWSAGLNQAPGQYACTFYGSMPVITNLKSVEIEVSGSGAFPEFIPHKNATAAGALVLVPGNPWRVGASTGWIKLPLGWGRDLLSGVTEGFAIASSGQVRTYTSTGRVRFTPLAVTI